MTNPYVKDIVAKIPFEPGIYMMKDEKGEIIYVGKAKNLKNRVRQYFFSGVKTQKVMAIMWCSAIQTDWRLSTVTSANSWLRKIRL